MGDNQICLHRDRHLSQYLQNKLFRMSGGDGDEKFCLRWNDFQQSISQSFQDFREDLTDVTIFCGKKKVEAHRLVLCACSSVFKDVILKNSAPNPSILLFGVELVELYNLLDFMYKGEVSVSQDRLQKFLDLAEKLEVKGLYQQGRGRGKPESERTKVNHRLSSTPQTKKIAEDVVTLAAPDYVMDTIQNYDYESFGDASEDPHGYMIPHHTSYRDDSITNYGEYPCIFCGKSYKTAGSLKNHRSLYHRDEITKNRNPSYSIM